MSSKPGIHVIQGRRPLQFLERIKFVTVLVRFEGK
jgi:hypothetical protein